MKYGAHPDGRRMGPVFDTSNINETGWQWFDTEADRDAALPLTLDRGKREKAEQARRQYQATLSRGFAFDGGQFAVGERNRLRFVELIAGVNAGRGFPGGKMTKSLRDNSGTIHDVDTSQILDMGQAANDFIEAADDNFEQLQADIDAAASQGDLDAIDVTAGWP